MVEEALTETLEERLSKCGGPSGKLESRKDVEILHPNPWCEAIGIPTPTRLRIGECNKSNTLE